VRGKEAAGPHAGEPARPRAGRPQGPRVKMADE
jgi:hypothetical protein